MTRHVTDGHGDVFRLILLEPGHGDSQCVGSPRNVLDCIDACLVADSRLSVVRIRIHDLDFGARNSCTGGIRNVTGYGTIKNLGIGPRGSNPTQ